MKIFIALGMAILTFSAKSALAHPMGNFSISHYTALQVESDELRIRYRIDLAEIPTFQEMAKLDADGDKAVSEKERGMYLKQKIEALTRGQSLFINQQATALAPVASDLEIRPGAGDLPTLLITIDYRVPNVSLSQISRVDYADHNYEQSSGWREIVARSGRLMVKESDVPQKDLSNELTAYPTDALLAPPQVSRASFTFSAQPPGQSPTSISAQKTDPHASAVSRQSRAVFGDRLTQLIAAKDFSLGLWWFSLIVAFALGSVHALSPGHGKTIVAAYLVGSRGTFRHALLLGGVVTLTHTAGVFLLGFIALFASRYVLPEQLYPWLGVVSGLLIAMIGAKQFAERYRHWQANGREPDHLHEHAHDHIHPHHFPDNSDPGHDPHPPAHGHAHQLNRITPAGLIGLGVSGGLVPCPSALVVLLSAITLNRIGFGLTLIVAFSAGLSCVLIGIGLLMLYARRWVERFHHPGRLMQGLPLFSSAAVLILGLFIAVQALVTALPATI